MKLYVAVRSVFEWHSHFGMTHSNLPLLFHLNAPGPNTCQVILRLSLGIHLCDIGCPVYIPHKQGKYEHACSTIGYHSHLMELHYVYLILLLKIFSFFPKLFFSNLNLNPY